MNSRSLAAASPFNNANLRRKESHELSPMFKWEDAESRIKVSTNSEETFGKKRNGWATPSCGTWSPDSFLSLSPPLSPSPICSPVKQRSFSATSERYLSQDPSLSSTPLNESFSILSNSCKISSSHEGEEIESVNNSRLSSKGGERVNRDCYPNSKMKRKVKSVRTCGKLVQSKPTTTRLSTSSEPINSSTYQAWHGDNKVEDNKDHHPSIEILRTSNSSSDSTISIYVDGITNTHRGAATQEGERPFNDFISGIERNRSEVKINQQKDSKSSKLMNKLKKKEAAISTWESKEVTRLSMDLKEIENKLEKQQSKALDKMQKQISSSQKKADKKRAKVRQRTARKITDLSKLIKNMTAIGKLPWWKKLLHHSP